MINDFKRIEPWFGEIGITKEWLYVLANGTTEFYNNTIVNHMYENGYLIINSGAIDNKEFSISAIKRIIRLFSGVNNVIISSSNIKIMDTMLNKYGFHYYKDLKSYIRST